MTLKSYLSAIILATITLTILISGALLVFVTKQTYIDGVSQRGMELAKVLARDARIIQGVLTSNQGTATTLQGYIEPIRAETDASYIVVTNQKGIRLSHPNSDRVGKTFIGDDILPTLEEGRVQTTVAVGSLGRAIRNFAPIEYDNQVIGAISIGYLEQSVAELLFDYYLGAALWLALIYIIAIAITLAIISKLKRTFLRFEPEEIVQRFKEHSLLLDSIREGIIAIDRQHRITAINGAAAGWLTSDHQTHELVGSPLSNLSNTLSLLIVEALTNRHKCSVTLGQHEFAVTLYPLTGDSNHSGYLIVLNHEQEMSELERELTRTTAYANQLRARTHEYNNKLNVISGLLQANKTNEAINYLQRESDAHQHMLGNLVKSIENSPVAGMLLAKYHYANEHQITFTLDEDSQLKNYDQSVNDDLITLIGNLIENAFYAVLNNNSNEQADVTLFISDRTNHLMVTVEDSGAGIDKALADRVLDMGVSTKEDAAQHGMGLYLVNRVVKHYNGSLDWERSEDSTTVFSVYLDKRELKK